MSKIVAFANTQSGVSSFTLLNPKLFAEQLRLLSGQIRITIETIDGDATDAQIHHFRSTIVATFVFEAGKLGNNYTEKQAEKYLIEHYGNGEIAQFDTVEEFGENGKKHLSDLIDNSRLFIQDFFNIEI